ncbi:MAG TPA: gamma-glutamyltransferase [Verrucomicrobiales bacterium]|nr:gamma-glutamyltransferase [Verrucomicrobiales bacterium]
MPRLGAIVFAWAWILAGIPQLSAEQTAAAKETGTAARSRLYAQGQHGAVATVHPLATEAALRVLREGGNAIDATVAAGLTLSVVDGFNSGIGGGCFFLIRSADSRITAIDGRETAPAAATPDMYVRDGKLVDGLSTTGPLACGVPGALAAWDMALRDHGTRSLAELLLAAADLAESGFILSEAYAGRLASVSDALRRFEGSRAVFLREDGSPLQAGERLVQMDLAETFRSVAREGLDWFYGGGFAQRIEDWMRENGGLLTATDFRGYRAKRRAPLVMAYRGHEVVGFPPPSSGGVHAGQILGMIETISYGERYGVENFRSLAAVDRWHLVAEAMKRAFADRAYWLGDPDFAPVPRGLLDPAYLRELAAGIDPKRALPVEKHGEPPNADADLFSRHTTHYTVADEEGNWAACTATINTTFGSKVVVPGTGVVLNNEMDDFSALPGAPNAFGLVGAEANAIAPGKRPLSSMSPTIVLRDGEPVFAVGAAGGPTIISQVVLAVMRRIDLGEELLQILAAPRLHHQWRPDLLELEPGWSEEIRAGLAERGHRIGQRGSMGVSQAVARGPSGMLEAASDPRVDGAAAAY